MRVPLSWLREYVDVPLGAAELAERLTAQGLAVEAVERPWADVRGVRVARVLAVQPHPQAERLRICTLDAGSGTVSVVTGAPNAAPGAWVVWAPPGARLSGGVPVEAREIRGVLSQGMVCSADELGLRPRARDEAERLAEGILVLAPDLPGLRPGADATGVLGLDEEVLVLELTPNQALHCQSVFGVAREVAAMLGTRARPPEVPPAAEDAQDAAAVASVRVDDPRGCPHYVARVIAGIRVGPSPLWLQRRLHAAGMRPVSNVVDVTNYVMLELGQPLHAFDLRRLAERRIVVRRARAGERIATLDGAERVLAAEDLVIADAERPVAVAGVIGGADSEVRADTGEILLESARFDPASVRRTALRLGLRTEASARFEKGVDPAGVEPASRRAAALIAQLGGGRVLRGAVDVAAERPAPRRIWLLPERINALLGTELAREDVKELLGRLGFAVREDGAGWTVEVPSHRGDVEGVHDLAEEVARLYGYDRIPSRVPAGAPAEGGRGPRGEGLLGLRHLVAACGFCEIYTYSFSHPGLADRLRLPADHPQRRAVRLANPMSEDQAQLRATLLGSMLDALAWNARRGNADLALFELGTVYLPVEGELPDERVHLIMAAMGRLRPLHWQHQEERADVYLLKGVVEEVARRLGVELAVEPASLPWLHPTRGAAVLLSRRPVGYLGELHPDVQGAWDLPGRVVVAELDADALLAARAAAPAFRPLPRHPAADRDVSFLAPRELPAARAEAVIREAAGPWLERVVLFDVYEGDTIPSGMRSLAFTLRYRAPDRTLTDREVEEVHARVRQALVERLGVRLR